jgi:hypothetical protein
MAEQITLAVAIKRHLSVENESMATLIAGIRALTPTDKAELREQFAREFGYEMVEAKA